VALGVFLPENTAVVLIYASFDELGAAWAQLAPLPEYMHTHSFCLHLGLGVGANEERIVIHA